MMRIIGENGVLLPLLARATEDGYKIISVFRRMTAALRLRLEKLPMQNMIDDEGATLDILHGADRIFSES